MTPPVVVSDLSDRSILSGMLLGQCSDLCVILRAFLKESPLAGDEKHGPGDQGSGQGPELHGPAEGVGSDG